MATTTRSQAASVEKRITRFYEHLNRGEYEACYRMIDPRVRENSASVTLLQYINSLKAFREYAGRLNVREITVALHLGEPNPLYEDRDFAVGQTVCEDARGEERIYQERWVREGRLWYTRSTGFVVP